MTEERFAEINAGRPPVAERSGDAGRWPGPGRASHEHDIERGDREDRVDPIALWHVADDEPGLPLNLAVERPEQAEDRAQQGSLARAVWSHDAQDVAAVNGKRQSLHDGRAMVPHTQHPCGHDGSALLHAVLPPSDGPR